MPDDSVYCAGCGRELLKVQPQIVPENPVCAVQSVPVKKRSFIVIIAAAVAVIVLLTVGAVGLWFALKTSASSRTEEKEAVLSDAEIEKRAKAEFAALKEKNIEDYDGELRDVFRSFSKRNVTLENYDEQSPKAQFEFARYVSAFGCRYIVRWLIECKKVDVNQIGDGGMLHLAALGGDVETVRFLISKGADCNLADKDGQVPLSWAMAQKDCLPIVKVLVEAGADVNNNGRRHSSLLSDAIRYGVNQDVIDYLIRRGAKE